MRHPTRTGIEPLTREHLTRLALRADHADYVRALGSHNQAIEEALLRGAGVALVVAGDVVAAAGVCPIWEGAGQMWMRTGVLARNHPYALARAARRFVDAARESLGLRRLQATVKADNAVAVRFIQWLGFAPEGLLRAYGPEGADYVMYARLAPLGARQAGRAPNAGEPS